MPDNDEVIEVEHNNGNRQLRQANIEENCEFYTKLEDIELEISRYTPYLKGKIILCNCDDPYESNFFKYFALNFKRLQLKKLIASCYDSSYIAGGQLPLFNIRGLNTQEKKHAYKIEITEIPENKDGTYDITNVEYLLKNDKNSLTLLKGNGDFRSKECLALLQEADICITNPPFNLFREFLAKLNEYNKDFIIIGNTNALTYREVFRMFKENRIRTGYTNFNVGMFFEVPDYYSKYHCLINGKKYARVSTSCWFSSLPVERHRESLVLYKHYSPEIYEKYENFDAINVNRYKEIPCDYDGIMGVPITFLDKFNPEQFELIGLGISNSGLEVGVRPYTEEHRNYRRNIQHKGAVDGDLYMMKNGEVVVPFARVLIRRRNNEN